MKGEETFMKNAFQKIMMVVVLAIVSFVVFGTAGKASAATWHGCSHLLANGHNTGAAYDYAFDVCDTDDSSNVYFSIVSSVPGAMYNVGGLFYYDAFLLRWNGSSWVKDRWINGNMLTLETKSRQFNNVPITGTPTLIWVDFYWADGYSFYLGSCSTPAWVR
jgi:hypothetical protein